MKIAFNANDARVFQGRLRQAGLAQCAKRPEAIKVTVTNEQVHPRERLRNSREIKNEVTAV